MRITSNHILIKFTWMFHRALSLVHFSSIPDTYLPMYADGFSAVVTGNTVHEAVVNLIFVLINILIGLSKPSCN